MIGTSASIALSFASSGISTAFDIKRKREAFLGSCAGRQTSRCELSTQTCLEGALSDTLLSRFTSISQDDSDGQRQPVGSSWVESICAELADVALRRNSVADSASSRNVWLADRIDRALHRIPLRLPEPLEQPSPQLLLVAWLVLTAVIAIHHREPSANKHKSAVMVASLCLAITVGIAEGADTTSMILMNVPWCMTISIVLGSVLDRVLQSRSRCVRQADTSGTRLEREKVEKEMY